MYRGFGHPEAYSLYPRLCTHEMYSDPQSRNPQPKVQRDRAPKAELGEVQKVAAPAMSTRLELRTSNLGLGLGGGLQ